MGTSRQIQLQCIACKKPSRKTRTRFTELGNVGTIISETGYLPISLPDDAPAWACPDCAKKISSLALQLHLLVDPNDEHCFSLNSLVALGEGR